MKKVVSLLLVSALLIGALSACKRNEPEPEPAPPEPVTPTYDYQDGEYAVSYAVPALDRTLDYLTISIKNDEITIVEAGCKEDVSLPAPSEETSGDAASAPTEPPRRRNRPPPTRPPKPPPPGNRSTRPKPTPR